MDEEPVVFYLDATADPDEIPKALVNTFSFAAGDVAVKAAPGVEVAPPEVRAGRIVLKLDLPAGACRANGRSGSPTRRTRAPPRRRSGATSREGSLTLALGAATPSFVQVRQDPGRMEFSGFPRQRMKHVETFRLDPIVE